MPILARNEFKIFTHTFIKLIEKENLLGLEFVCKKLIDLDTTYIDAFDIFRALDIIRPTSSLIQDWNDKEISDKKQIGIDLHIRIYLEGSFRFVMKDIINFKLTSKMFSSLHNKKSHSTN